MELVNWLEQIMVGFGAGWVMWLLIGLSVLSVAVILERAWFFYSLRDDLDSLANDLRRALDRSLSEAKKRMDRSPSAEGDRSMRFFASLSERSSARRRSLASESRSSRSE